jgi:pyruvate dehydrogenase E2 component (dihydrolipoamide acetyltransferase)
MAEVVLMPKSGISVETCLIGSWKKEVNDEVSIGDILFDYETDKALFECESTVAGVLLEKFYEDGDEVEVMKPVCAIGQPGEDVSGLRGDAAPATAEKTEGEGHARAGGDVPAPVQAPEVGAQATLAETPAGEMIKAAPRAKELARRLGVDLGGVTPSGPRGRIIEQDVRDHAGSSVGVPAALRADAPAAAFVASQADASGTGPDYIDEKFSKIRRVIADSMMASLREMAQLTHHHSFDASTILRLRGEFKGSDNDRISGISVGDIILYAVSRALMEYPGLNCHLLGGDTLRKFDTVNLGVAIDTSRGLIVPTIFGAERKSLAEISAEVKQLAEAARSGSISPDLLTGGTFTVSNLGPTGVEMFTPIINPPQVAILGVCGSVMKIKAGKDGVETYPSIGLSLTYDHRAIDGAPASRFAQALGRKLESAGKLLTL